MTIRQQVENILRASHKARNSDKELYLIYMLKSGMGLSQEQIETFRKMPSLEAVRRTRQKIQEDGLYPADPEVDQERFRKFKAMRENIVHTQEPAQLIDHRGEYSPAKEALRLRFKGAN